MWSELDAEQNTRHIFHIRESDSLEALI
jgi:hypothetical protein